jgi:uncharacterized membrane protein (DUF485 family)
MHEPPPSADPAPLSNRRHVRFGLILFAVYLLLYIGFVGLAAFAPHLMSEPWIGGVNVAIGYGMGLILAAILLALLYTWLCRPHQSDAYETSAEGRA